MVNGKQIGGEYTYVRRNTNSYMPSFMEIIDSSVSRLPYEYLSRGTDRVLDLI